jgi:CRP-like cAMP-binding protein
MSLNTYSIKALSQKLNNFPLFKELEVASMLKAMHFFSDVDESYLNDVSDSLMISEFCKDDIICRHGVFDKQFSIIISGQIKAIIPTEPNTCYELFTLVPGDFFGEEILFSNEPRVNTLIAVEDTMVLTLSKDVLKKLMAKSRNIKSLVDQEYIERKLRRDLRRVKIFSLLDNNLFNELLKKVELITLPKDTVIFNEGDEGDAFYLIGKGQVNVLRVINEQKKVISMLSDGQFFGETALLLKQERNATVETSATTELVKISREAFIEIVKKDKRLSNELQEIIKERNKNRDSVLSNPIKAVISRKLLDVDNVLYKHIDIISHCTVDTDIGSNLLATLPESRYPYVYPRDNACASRLFYKLATSPLKSGDFAFKRLVDIARCMLNFQREDGYWGQRYDINGKDNSIYKQEDNIAHAVVILCRYLLAAKHTGKNVLDPEKIIEAIARGSEYALKNYYRNEIHLFYSTTSIHESAIEEGYSIWVNFAYLLMLRLMERIGKEYGIIERFSEEMALKDFFESNIYKVFSLNERFVRRIRPSGDIDLRPDITLMSPFYFSTGMDVEYFKNTENLINSIEYIEQKLWDPELGLLQRYLPFIEDPHTHIHAGNGPWIQYSSILAQYYFYIGNLDRGNKILEMIDRYSTKEGYQCEHLTTPNRFYEFNKLEWINGIDTKKELFTKEILLPDIPHDFLVEELIHMQKAYYEINKECRDKINREYITFVTPLMWSHAEYAMALILRAEKEMEEIELNQKIPQQI